MYNFKSANTFVSSDTHFRHAKEFVWKKRGYSSVDEHDNMLIDSINDVIKPDDNFIHLGDFCLNATVDDFDKLISRINCKNIYLIWGNHPNPQYKNIYLPIVKRILGEAYTPESTVYPIRYKNVIFIGHYAEVIIGGKYVVLNHYPIYVWNEMMHGAWMLCGHSHNGCKLSQATNTEGKILDVGWDGHGKPWSFDELKQVMETKKFVPTDDHHQ